MIKDYELKHLLKANIEDFAQDLFNGKTADGLAESLQTMNEIVDRFVDKYKPEPAKPVLPKDVADEMEVFRKSNKLGAYLNLALNHTETVAYRWTNNDRNIVSLVNAWYNGYTVENDKEYNVKVPHTKDVWYYKSWNSDLLTISDKKLRSEFTESEIEHYGLQDCEKVESVDDGN